MSISLHDDFSQLRNPQRALEQLAAFDRHELLDALGAETESQVRRRVLEEKTAPDGTPWPAWSPAYAKTRHANHSLLRGEDHLLQSLQYIVSGDHVETGSNLAYALIQNDGGKIKKPERKSSVYFKHYKDGSVGKHFVKKSKSNFAQDVTIGAHEIDMPQRQYLGFSSKNEAALMDVVEVFLRAQLERVK